MRKWLSMLLTVVMAVMPMVALAEGTEDELYAAYRSALALRDEGDNEQCFEEMMVLAEQGYAKAMYAVGWCYINETLEGMPDVEKGLEWLLKAEQADSKDARYALGYYSAQGTFTDGEPDRASALQWWIKGAIAGDHDCMFSIAHYYMYDAKIKDLQQATVWLERAYKAGSASAAWNLAKYYRDGVITDGTPDLAKALEWMIKAANSDYPGAARYVVSCYTEKVTAEDGTLLLTAADLLEFLEGRYAAGIEDTYLLDWLGWLLTGNDETVEADYQRAYEVYRKSADLGSGYAMYQVGSLYKDGKLGMADDVSAQAWYDKATEAGYPESAQEETPVQDAE